MVGGWLLMHLLHSKKKYRKKVDRKQNPLIENTKLSVLPNTHLSVKEEIVESENVQTCRVCLKYGKIPIYSRTSEDLPGALTDFGGIVVETDDKYPKFLCRSCHELLLGAILLRKTAQQSDKLLRQSETLKLTLFDEVDHSDNNSLPDEKSTEVIWSYYCKSSEGLNIFDKCRDPESRQEEEKKRHDSSSNFLMQSKTDLLENYEVKHNKNSSDPEDKPIQKTSLLYCCKTCELSFNTFEEYSEHRLSDEHENKRHTCPICKKMYASNYLKKHLAIHKMDYQFVCDICGKKFFQQAHFTYHRAIHFHNFPFHCEHCPYKGRFKEALKMHMRSHTGEKPYSCTQCPTKCVSKSNLNKHMRIHKTEHDFKCSACGKGFHTKIDLEKHFKVEHHGIKDHVCNECGKAFGYRKQLMKHKLNVHKRQKMKSGGMPVYMKVQCQDSEPT